MIAAGMIHPASVFAATMNAAVRWGKWFSEISNLHGVGGLIFVDWAKSFPHILIKECGEEKRNKDLQINKILYSADLRKEL